MVFSSYKYSHKAQSSIKSQTKAQRQKLNSENISFRLRLHHQHSTYQICCQISLFARRISTYPYIHLSNYYLVKMPSVCFSSSIPYLAQSTSKWSMNSGLYSFRYSALQTETSLWIQLANPVNPRQLTPKTSIKSTIVLQPESVLAVLKYFLVIIAEDASTMARDDATTVVIDIDILGYRECSLNLGWYMSQMVSRMVMVLCFPKRKSKVFDFQVDSKSILYNYQSLKYFFPCHSLMRGYQDLYACFFFSCIPSSIDHFQVKMESHCLKIPSFTPTPEVLSAIRTGFKVGNSIVIFRYLATNIFSSFQEHTEIYQRLAVAHFSILLKDVEITINAMEEPQNINELSHREEALLGFLRLLAERCKGMEKFSLWDEYMNNSMVRVIARAQWDKLKILQLQRSRIDQKGVRFLVNAQFAKLEVLRLDCSPIGNKGAKIIVRAQWPKLKELSLVKCLLTCDIIKLFSKMRAPKLQALNLSYNGLFFNPLSQFVRVKVIQVASWQRNNFRQHQRLLFVNRMMKSKDFRSFFEKAWILEEDQSYKRQIKAIFSTKFKLP